MASSSEKKTMTSKGEGDRPWSAVFARTSGLPCVFTVRSAHYDQVNDLVRSLNLPTHHQGGLFVTWYWATPLLDGYVLWNSTEGFPAGQLPSGMRVVGTNPLRLLCHLLDLTQPRKFASEDSIPSPESLVERLEAQESNGGEALRTDSKSMLFASDRSGLVVLACQLYGEEALPEGYAGSDIPAPGQWGEAGLSRLDYRQFMEANVSLGDAIQWKQLVEPVYVANLVGSGVTLDDLLAWHEEGINVLAVPHLKRVGATVSEVKEWEAAGGHAYNYPIARECGISINDLQPYFAIGFPDLQAMNLFEHHVSDEHARDLLEEVNPRSWEYGFITTLAIKGMDRTDLHRWVSLGVPLELIVRAIEADVSVETVEKFARTPKTPQQLEKYILKRWRASRRR